MDATKWRFVLMMAVGGSAVLGSYAYEIASHPGSAGDAWGDLPERIRPLYTASMFTAATGWFLFTSYLLLRVPTGEARVADRFGYGLFIGLQAVILAGSALWMPLTFRLLDAPVPSPTLWWLIRLDLLAVGVASLALIPALLALRPRYAPGWHRLAVLGAVLFTFQTLVLDALIWPAFFPV